MSKIETKVPVLKDGGGLTMHDLSHYFGFKFAPGHAVPVYSDILNPNERVKLKVNSFIRLQPMVTPAFLDLECVIDYFFVPMEMLDISFGRNFSKTPDVFSSYLNPTIAPTTALPLFNGRLVSVSQGEDLQYFFGYDTSSYDATQDRDSLSFDGRPAFESNGNRFIRLMDYLGLDLPAAFNSIYTIPTAAVSGDVVVNDAGNPITTIYSNNVDPLHMTDPSVNKSGFSMYRTSFPWKILAYNAIWENWYRLDDFIQFDNRSFNIDSLTPGNKASTDFSRITSRYDWSFIKYVPKKLDYFTSSVNNPVLQTANLFSSLPFNPQYLTENKTLQYSLYNSSDDIGYNGISSSVGSVNISSHPMNPEDIPGLSMARLRLIKAQEKMLQIYGRLPKKNYDTFVYALFGAKVPHDVKHELSHLGRDSFKINVGQVTSTASTTEAPLGEYAGQAAGSSKSRGIKFTAPCHGIIMAVQYVKPEFMYQGGFLRENYIVSMNSFFLPPFDNLGRQPIYGFERDFSLSPTGILGWQFRWQEFKSRYNRVTRAFKFGSERSWFLVNDNALATREQPGASYSFDIGSRYVDPCCLNDIMVQQFDPNFKFDLLTRDMQEKGVRWNDLVNYWINPSLVYSTDPFICIDKIDSIKFSKMSKYSLQTVD